MHEICKQCLQKVKGVFLDRFRAMATFVKIVEAGSLSAAARSLGQSLATVSRQISSHEELLGTDLLVRKSRNVMLTDSGRAYYERSKRILREVEEAAVEVSQDRRVLSGDLSICAPELFGRLYLAPALPAFLEAAPHVSVELTLIERFFGLAGQDFDVTIRIGPLEDSALIARKLGSFRRVACAAPMYLRQYGTPTRPADLAKHQCHIISTLPDAGEWRFQHKRREVSVRVSGRFRSNNPEAVRSAAVGGAGLILAPTWLVRDDIASGRLSVVLNEFELPRVLIHALFPRSRHLSTKVRAFVDFVAERWAREDFGASARPSKKG
jgi:DNA-binding transcriptional LysR family regulator